MRHEIKLKKDNFPSQLNVDDTIITHPQEITHQFNKYFSEIGSRLSSNIKINDEAISFKDYLNTPTMQCFNFSTITT